MHGAFSAPEMVKRTLSALEMDAKGPVVCQARPAASAGDAKRCRGVWMRRKGHMTKCWYVMSWNENRSGPNGVLGSYKSLVYVKS